MDLFDKAIEFAVKTHSGSVRKGTEGDGDADCTPDGSGGDCGDDDK